MRLPNGDRATIRREKIDESVLNPNHPVGKHKARLFSLLRGLNRSHADLLIDALKRAAMMDDAVLGREDAFGKRYVLDFEIEGLNGVRTVVRSAWIVRDGSPPDFVTCFIL